MAGFGSLAPDDEPPQEWWRALLPDMERLNELRAQGGRAINQGRQFFDNVGTEIKSRLPAQKPDWYNPQPSQGAGEITTPDRRAQVMPPNGGQGADPNWLTLPPSTFRQDGRQIPHQLDNMVVPPYDLPPDRNTRDPQDIMQNYFNPPGDRADKLLPPPANPVQDASNAVFGSLAQPFREAADAIGGRMSEQEAKDFAFNAAIGILPMGRGLQGVRMGAMGAPRAANAIGKPATAYDDAMSGVMGAMGEVQPAPLKIPTAGNTNLPMDSASRAARAREQGFNVDAYHGTLSPKEFTAFRRRQNDIGIHFGTAGQANDRIDYLSGINFADDKVKAPYSGDARIFPVKLKVNNPLRLDDAGWWSPDNLAHEMRKSGHFDDAELSRAIRGGFTENPRSQLVALRELIERKGFDGVVYKNSGETTGAAPLQAEVERLREAARTASPQSSIHQSLRLAEDNEKRFRSTNAEDSYIALRPNQVRSPFAAFDPAQKNSGNLLAGIAGGGVMAGGVGAQMQESPFDDKLIDILKKYGLAGMTAGGAAGASFGSLAPGEN